MKDQSAGCLQRGRPYRRQGHAEAHNELLIKNDLTRTDDPSIDEIPVVPLDLQGGPDPNESQSITQLIDEAMKNRPEVAIFRNQAEVLRQSVKDINSELLPQLNLYGYYGARAPPALKNPFCTLGVQECAASLPTDFSSMFVNTFNYSAPQYKVGSISPSTSATVWSKPTSSARCSRTAKARSPRSSSRRAFASTSATRSSLSCRRKPAWRPRRRHAIWRRRRLISPRGARRRSAVQV